MHIMNLHIAMFDALADNVIITGRSSPVRVENKIAPSGEERPYVILGDDFKVENNTKDFRGSRIRKRIRVFSDDASGTELLLIMKKVVELLDRNTSLYTNENSSLVSLFLRDERTMVEDKETPTFSGMLEFEALIYDNA